MSLLSEAGWLFLLRWIHFLSGITWIGLLYYFNFVQVPFFAETEAPVRSALMLIIMAPVEINALTGTPGKGAAKPLATVKGTLWFGFILTVVFYLVFMVLGR